jgi:uncharacterized membrane protein YdbT with pleckstrin-like domain
MATSYLHNLLGENERIVLLDRQHWFVLLSAILMEIFLILAIIAAATLALIFFPVTRPWAALGYLLLILPLITMSRDILVWSNREYIITNLRVIQINGVYSKNVIDSSLEKVNDVKLEQSILGRIFNYGDVEILTASELGVNLFRRIGEPVKFKTAMLNAKERLEHGDESASAARSSDIPTLIANLDQLRKQGLLTDEEFQQKKADLLTRM